MCMMPMCCADRPCVRVPSKTICDCNMSNVYVPEYGCNMYAYKIVIKYVFAQ